MNFVHKYTRYTKYPFLQSLFQYNTCKCLYVLCPVGNISCIFGTKNTKSRICFIGKPYTMYRAQNVGLQIHTKTLQDVDDYLDKKKSFTVQLKSHG